MATLGFLGRIPPEIRVMIYHEVLGSCKVITPITGDKVLLKGDQMLQSEGAALYIKPHIHTSIFATNKFIANEALYVLYKDRTVRGDIVQLSELLRNNTFCKIVGSVEVKDCITGFKNKAFRPTLLQLQALPRNCSTVILSDCLGLLDNEWSSFITVREFAHVARLGIVTCVDIGRFRLCDDYERIQIVHRKLVKMWPDVKNTPKDYDVCSDVLGLIKATPLNLANRSVPAWAAQTSLRRWVGLFDELVRVRANELKHEAGLDKQQLLIRFKRSTRYIDRWNPVGTGLVPTYRLRELTPRDPAVLLETATDILSVNIAAYYAESGENLPAGLRGLKLRAAHWVDADSGTHTHDIMSEHASTALEGQANAHYMSHPVMVDHLLETSALRAHVHRSHSHMLWSTSDYLSPIEIRQIYLLYLAMGLVTVAPVAPGHALQQATDEWSLRLLKRYLLAAGSVYEDEANGATLRDARLAMARYVGSLMAARVTKFQLVCELLRRKGDPVDELDRDLVRHLAWEYNLGFVIFWRSVMRLHVSGWQDKTQVSWCLMEILIHQVQASPIVSRLF
jgi:hypothetical protein